METANLLANIFGLSFIAIGLSFLIYQKEVQGIIEFFENKARVFIFGILSFVIGVAMVLSYNVWTSDWKVIITIFGWVALLKGLVALFMPETTIKYIKKAKDASWLSYGLVAVVILGCVLIYFGFVG